VWRYLNLFGWDITLQERFSPENQDEEANEDLEAQMDAWLDSKRRLLSRVAGLLRDLLVEGSFVPHVLLSRAELLAEAALQQATQLTELYLDWPGERPTQAAEQAFQRLTRLTRLELACMPYRRARVPPFHFLGLLPALPSMHRLTALSLDLRGLVLPRALNEKAASLLTAAFTQLPTLRSFEWEGTAGVALLQALSHASQLESLKLNSPGLLEQAERAELAASMRHMPGLHALVSHSCSRVGGSRQPRSLLRPHHPHFPGILPDRAPSLLQHHAAAGPAHCADTPARADHQCGAGS